MSKVEQIEAELKQFSAAELREVREWLHDLVEDSLPFSSEFESVIQESEREKASGAQPRVRKP